MNSQDVSKQAGDLMDRAKRVAGEGFERVRQAAGGTADTAKDWLESSLDTVRNNPTASLLAALGAGFVLGWIYKNR